MAKGSSRCWLDGLALQIRGDPHFYCVEGLLQGFFVPDEQGRGMFPTISLTGGALLMLLHRSDGQWIASTTVVK